MTQQPYIVVSEWDGIVRMTSAPTVDVAVVNAQAEVESGATVARVAGVLSVVTRGKPVVTPIAGDGGA